MRSVRILNGERGPQVRGSVYEWPSRTSSALDTLLSEIQFASDQRSRMDTLIRSYAAQDNKTGLNNRLSLIISWPRCWTIRKKWGRTGW
jgi:RNase E specificity factor CsrD